MSIFQNRREEPDKEGPSFGRPTPEYLHTAKMKAESTLQFDKTTHVNSPSVMKPDFQETHSRNEINWPGTFRLSRDVPDGSQRNVQGHDPAPFPVPLVATSATPQNMRTDQCAATSS